MVRSNARDSSSDESALGSDTQPHTVELQGGGLHGNGFDTPKAWKDSVIDALPLFSTFALSPSPSLPDALRSTTAANVRA